MPSIYAHNKFGKKVLSNLNEEQKNIIKKYPSQFRIGLQGPDYLFFYKPYKKNSVTKIGHELHDKIAAEFFNNGIEIIKEKGINTGYFSYLMGFVCHFALDSECHPYVEQAIQELDIGHIEIESEFDKMLMQNDGKDPLTYPVWKLVPTDLRTAVFMSPFYIDVNVATIKSSLSQMKLVKWLLMPNKVKEKICTLFFRLTPYYVDLQGHIMKQKTNEKCNISNERLNELFTGAIDVASMLITNLNDCIENDDMQMSERFNRNFH